jgi:hypothetical protein
MHLKLPEDNRSEGGEAAFGMRNVLNGWRFVGNTLGGVSVCEHWLRVDGQCP